MSGQRQVRNSAPPVQTPRQIIADCYHLFAFDNDEIREQKEFLLHGIDRQLGNCDVCIVEYYKSKKQFLDVLRE